MSTPIFTLDAAPTFPLTVKIPVAGYDKPAEFNLVFKHHPVDEYQAKLQAAGEQLTKASDADSYGIMTENLLYLIEAWQFDAPVNAENVRKLVVNYPRAYAAIVADYFAELMGLREKN